MKCGDCIEGDHDACETRWCRCWCHDPDHEPHRDEEDGDA